MALQALRRGAAASMQRGVVRCLLPQQRLAAPANRAVSSGMALGAEARAPLWALASRMASTARESGRDADGALVSILKSELDHERKSYRQAKELSYGPPKPWTLTDKRGHADVILRRTYGLEDVAVTCVYQPDVYGDDGEQEAEGQYNSGDEAGPDGAGACINMTITITKGSNSPTLEISAASYGTEIVIDHVHFYELKDPKEATYEGPNFLQLDDEVQKQFERFIRARGVNKELTGYLFNILADKEHREYVRWLENVESFVRK